MGKNFAFFAFLYHFFIICYCMLSDPTIFKNGQNLLSCTFYAFFSRTQKRIFKIFMYHFVSFFFESPKKSCNVILKNKEKRSMHFGFKGEKESFFIFFSSIFHFGHVQNKKWGVLLAQKLSDFPPPIFPKILSRCLS